MRRDDKNVLIRRTGGGPQELRIGPGGRLSVLSGTFLDLNVAVASGGGLSLTRCVIGGERKPGVQLFSNTVWRGSDNRYDIATLRVDKTAFTSKTFAEFQKFTGSEAGSKWESLAKVPEDVGADEASLQHLNDSTQNH